jgi:hypothetical protein
MLWIQVQEEHLWEDRKEWRRIYQMETHPNGNING